MRFLILLFFAIIFPNLAPNLASAEPVIQAELISQSAAIEAGKPLRLGVVLHHPEGWHTYYKDSGDAGLPTELKWQLPEGFSASEINWPTPQKFSEGTLTTYGYTGDVTFPVTISVPNQLIDKQYNFKVNVQWLACKDICIPEEQELAIELPVGVADISSNSNPSNLPSGNHSSVPVEAVSELPSGVDNTDNTELSAVIDQQPTTANTSLIATFFLALLGGLVLNLMPCVLPVLSLKALALVKKSGRARGHTARHGIAYSLGILASFATIAAILIFLQKSGEAVGWGYQMQFPAFVGFLVYLLFLVGLSLSGAFHLPVLLGGVGGNLANEANLRGSFFTGVLAAMVATPCTAPFMASAVGAALILPEWAAMLVFLSLGFGLALPFLLISIFPSTLRFLPKQGAWMVRFKEFLAFPIYASVIWLLWVLNLQVGAGAVAMILAVMLFLVFALWLKTGRLLALLVAGMVMAATLSNLAPDTEKTPEIPYSKTTVDDLRAQGKAVYIDATAAWCITCQLNKRVVLENANVQAAFAENNITLMVADWTRKNPEITEFLHEFGYNGVPLNVFYPANNAPPIVLPQLLSEKIVIEAISR